MKLKDIILGNKYGHLIPIYFIKAHRVSKRRSVFCKCDCGNTTLVLPANLMRGTFSCGCQQLVKAKEANAKIKAYPNDPESYQINQLYLGYRNRGLKNKGFNLTRKEFRDLIKSNCHYCGSKPSQKITFKYGNSLIYNGIDRINNNKGYTRNNTVSCCGTCNKMKLTLTVEEFYKHILQIIKHKSLEI